MGPSLGHYVVLSSLLLSIGIFGTLTRRNIIGILMSIELIFNAANINLVAFNHFLHPGGITGNAVTLFIIAVAAAEAVVGLALVVAIYRNTDSIYSEDMTLLQG